LWALFRRSSSRDKAKAAAKAAAVKKPAPVAKTSTSAASEAVAKKTLFMKNVSKRDAGAGAQRNAHASQLIEAAEHAGAAIISRGTRLKHTQRCF